MSRTAAKVTQADVARIVRAAKQAGAASVTVKVGPTGAEIVIGLEPEPHISPLSTKRDVAPAKEIIL